MPVESYIVRIYRRDRECPERANGIVQQVENGSETSFADMHGLWEILVGKARKSKPGVARNSPRLEKP
jgi:hypothetical protein